MTCIVMSNPIRAIVCIDPWARFHIGNSYYWMSYHSYCGPRFYHDSAMTREYEPEDDDPIWEHFDKWLEKHRESEHKRLEAKVKP